MSNPQILNELLTAATSAAAEKAKERLGRNLTVTETQPVSGNALLRFDITFPGEAALSWFVSNEDATGLSDLLVGGTGDRNAVLTEPHLDALSGAFSEMLEQAVAAVNGRLTAPLEAGGVDMGMETQLPAVEPGGASSAARFDIEGFGPLVVVQYANAALARVLQDTVVTAAPAPSAATAVSYDNVVNMPQSRSNAGDLGPLFNVPLGVHVELGRTERTVAQLLDMNVGAILELNKLAGDPVDIMVNGKLLARGEVVVIDESFGIRVTEILSPEQRLQKLA